jgi:GT2 family glycosyltransferase/glycosyltransferase involved in cell wall biosynthesis
VPDRHPADLRIATFGEGVRAPAWLAMLADFGGGTPIDQYDTTDPLDALRRFTREYADTAVLMIEAGAVLPKTALVRLRRAIEAAPEAGVVSALGNADPELSPLPEGATAAALDAAAVDRGCFLYSDRRVIGSAAWLRTASYWRAPALAWLLAHPAYRGPRLPDAVAGAVCDHLFVADPRRPFVGPAPPDDPRHPPPASPLSALRARFAPVHATAPAAPGLDGRPVVLHVLHGWGGGAEAFVRDLALADHDRCHLALVARGHTSRKSYGETLELVLPAATGAPPLRRWPLPRAIAATTDSDPGYVAVLRAVLAGFAVDGIVVSSLIGHDLAALDTGQPTAQVWHDYYPLWPVLHCDFGDESRRFDRAELDKDLRAGRDASLFAEADAAAWWSLRERYVELLRRRHPVAIAPSASVQRNATRIEPALADLDWRVIGHGFRAFESGGAGIAASAAPAVAQHSAPSRRGFRVLVLGRISGGKGERLLREVIPALAGEMDFHLLGCGTAGEQFFGCSGVDIELDYARDDLPALVARIAPDAALVAASVAETWNYTLSELWALRVPVLATSVGSLAERIEHGRTGWLVPATTSALVAGLRVRAADPAGTAAVRATLATLALRDTQAMARDHAAALPLPACAVARYAVARDSPADLQLARADSAATRAHNDLVAQTRALRAERAEVERRTDWALQVEREMQGELQRERAVSTAERARAQAELDERTAWAQRLDAELRDAYAERDRILHSLSWRMTRPLRGVGRALRGLRVSAAFRWQRLRALVGRVNLSLRTRGLGPTLRRAWQEFEPAAAPALPFALPDLKQPFAPFAVPKSDAPRASIVIPVYNHFAHTLACLRSLAANPGEVPLEIIVVDDASSDETADRLGAITGVRVVRNAANLGFIGACNAGAAIARGEYLVFLNNDTAVAPGWLAALLDTFVARPDAGLAGAKLVYPDGRLQEAGGIVFADGSGWNYGRFGDPAHPSHDYVREADYCSGAAIAIPRESFASLGGFDARYAPAYYEDTDLAFRVRESGRRAYYQPASVVVHFEGITSGTDTGSGTKRFQAINQEKFIERWRVALAGQPRPGTPIAIAREHRVRGRVLVIDAVTPMPDHDSGSVRMVNLMRLLVAAGWKVSFFADNRARLPGYTDALQQLGVEAWYQPWLGDPVAWFREHGALLDAVIVSRHYVAASYQPLVREFAPHARLVFDTVDLHFLREERAAALDARDDLRRIAAQTRSAELAQVRAADVTLVVSPVEQDLLRVACPGARVEVLSNVHEVVGSRRPFAERKDLWFVGGFQHPPNVDAVRWFLAEVWPQVEQALPDALFHVVGSRMPPELQALADARVRVHGHVPDLAPFLDGCRVSVAPLRYGAGVKGKVNHSMAHGQPVVATPVAVEGMHARSGDDVLVAETPADFAAAIVRAYTDEALWQKLSANGLDNVRRHFSFDAAREALSRILPTL